MMVEVPKIFLELKDLLKRVDSTTGNRAWANSSKRPKSHLGQKACTVEVPFSFISIVFDPS